MSDTTTYTIRREIDPSGRPTEWETRPGWSGLTARQAVEFLREVRDDPAWHGRAVRVRGADGSDLSASDFRWEFEG